jgi:hypothetical protein
MAMMTSRRTVLLAGIATALHGCGGSDEPDPGPGPDPDWPPPLPGPPGAAASAAWSSHGGDFTHAARAPVAAQALQRTLWTTPVDLAPPYRAGGFLLIHYGAPVISALNAVLLPVKRDSAGAFRVEARDGVTGNLLWQQNTDYILPASSWTPSMNIALHGERLFIPAAGGRLLVRDQASSATGALGSLLFYNSTAPLAALNQQIRINTALTVDAAGNVYFGFIADPGNAAGLTSGIARVARDGSASWRAANALAGDGNVTTPAMNCAPALSPDGQTLYVVVNIAPTASAPQSGYLMALDSTTLAFKAKRALVTPQGLVARVSDSSSASPTVGSDGDVYYGVLDFGSGGHNGRGWLLHFDATLALVKTPGSFGWDDTPSIVPAAAVPSYAGTSPYLLLCKYNNYYGAGTGDGLNQMAVLDPNGTQADPVAGAGTTVMREILVITGPTPDPGTVGGRREWCVNTAVVDPATRAAFINSEDGRAYRWDFATNTLNQSVVMNSGVGQAYTATVMGPTGILYAVNNAQLHAIGA